MSAKDAGIVIATYRVKSDRKEEFLGLLKTHHPTLKRLGLVTDRPPVVYAGDEEGAGPIVFEIFEWVDGAAAEAAHQTPEVARIWEAMGTMVEKRGGKPEMEFLHVKEVDLSRKA